jgi:hypothetical protein
MNHFSHVSPTAGRTLRLRSGRAVGHRLNKDRPSRLSIFLCATAARMNDGVRGR